MIMNIIETKDEAKLKNINAYLNKINSRGMK